MARSSPPFLYISACISPVSPPYVPCISGAIEPASPSQRLAAPPLHTRPAALLSAAQLRKLAATLEESFVAAMAAGAGGGAGAGDRGGGEGGGEEAAALAVSALEEGALCRELDSDESSSASSGGGGSGGGGSSEHSALRRRLERRACAVLLRDAEVSGLAAAVRAGEGSAQRQG